jgi:Flp pilus assembly protein TadD
MLALALYALLGKGESSKWRWVSGGIIVLIFMTGGIFWLNRGSSLVKHNPLLNRFASISLSDASNQSRLYIWPMAWKGGMEHPVLGWGQENFSYIFQARYNPAMYSQEKWFDRAHNVFLDWFVSAGFIGLAAYLALYFLSIFHVWRSSLSIKEKIVLIGMIAAYAIHSMFVFDNIASYIIFFFLLGYVGSLKSGVLVKPHGDVAPSAKALHPDTVKYSLLPIVTVVLLVTVYYLNIRPIITGTNLILAVDSCPKDDPDAPLFQSVLGAGMNWMDRETDEEMFSCAIRSSGEPAVSSEAKKAIIDLADSETKKPRITAHDDARSDFDEGAFLDQVGLTSEAQSLLERAHDLSPAKQDISFELAADYLYQSKDEEAVSILKQAYESATQYSTAASAYAVALVIDGKGDEARKIPGVDAALLDRVESYGKDHLKPIIAYQGVIVDQSDFTLLVQQSRREYAAGMNDQAVQTLQHVENIYPEYKDLMESAISQIRKSSSQSL